MAHVARREQESECLATARRGFLATSSKGRVTIVPICFVNQGNVIYTAIDRKPKGNNLARIRNIELNPNVAFIVDKYYENWKRLSYLLIHGEAKIVKDEEEAKKAKKLLTMKYPQYRKLKLDNAPVIAIQVRESKFWQFSSEQE